MAIKKPVSFSTSVREQKILQHAESKMSFSVYVKELIETDMEKEKEVKKPQKGMLSLDF